jgi:hypothetical protein
MYSSIRTQLFLLNVFLPEIILRIVIKSQYELGGAWIGIVSFAVVSVSIEAHTISYPVSSWGSFPWDKAAGA